MNESEDQNAQLLTEVKKHFDVVAESLESKIQLVAEGVLNVNEKLDRLQAEMHEESQETRALIKLSYTELDRRLTTLEGTVESLTRRVGDLEARQS
jgi:phage-related tail protein